MPALTLSTPTAAATEGEEFTYTTAVSSTYRLWTFNCRVDVIRVIVDGDWEDDQTSRGHTPQEVFDFASPAGADWKFVVHPQTEDEGITNLPDPRIMLEAFV